MKSLKFICMCVFLTLYVGNRVTCQQVEACFVFPTARFKWITCVEGSKIAHVHVFVLRVSLCECLCGLIFTLFSFSSSFLQWLCYHSWTTFLITERKHCNQIAPKHPCYFVLSHSGAVPVFHPTVFVPPYFPHLLFDVFFLFACRVKISLCFFLCFFCTLVKVSARGNLR